MFMIVILPTLKTQCVVRKCERLVSIVKGMKVKKQSTLFSLAALLHIWLLLRGIGLHHCFPTPVMCERCPTQDLHTHFSPSLSC